MQKSDFLKTSRMKKCSLGARQLGTILYGHRQSLAWTQRTSCFPLQSQARDYHTKDTWVAISLPPQPTYHAQALSMHTYLIPWKYTYSPSQCSHKKSPSISMTCRCTLTPSQFMHGTYPHTHKIIHGLRIPQLKQLKEFILTSSNRWPNSWFLLFLTSVE